MRVVRTLMLVFTVSAWTHAGNMDNGVTSPPPAPATAAPSTDGIMNNGLRSPLPAIATAATTSTDGDISRCLIQIALNLAALL